MNVFTWAYIEGALIVTAIGFLLLALVLIVLIHWLESRLWRRFVHACGGEKSAMAVLEAAEASAVSATDVFAGHAFKAASRFGHLPEDVQ